ncbi:hypothetical protein ZWY2020_039782 [Hordeum vulgare]|nr:hypothetical protein ZWY2020_039782 [Hordeum vulgare]
MSKFATPPPTSNSDMSPMLDDATSAIHDAYDDALLDNDMPLGEFLDAQIARVTVEFDDTSQTDEIIEVEPRVTPVRPSSPRYELPNIPKGYVMEGEVAEDFLACKDSYDLENLLRKWKEKSLNARMKYDPKFATSAIFVTDKDYEFSVDPELITLVESDPLHGYESETVVAHLTKLNDIATLFTNEEKIVITISLSCFLSH